MTLSRPGQACYCVCCCLSTDPLDSNDTIPEYNRRYDCSCKRRWFPGCLDVWQIGWNDSLDTLKMRARDLGKTKEADDLMVIEDALYEIVGSLP